VQKSIARIVWLFLLPASLTAGSRAPSAESPQQSVGAQELPASAPAVGTADTDLNRPLGRIWRVSGATAGRASGSIYVFLPNGTLLETSCVETYRIATWTSHKNEPGVLRVVEDGRPAFTAKIGESTGKTLQLQQTLLLGSKERRDLALTSVEGEFVCPDLLK
jgi:hypothetical protein